MKNKKNVIISIVLIGLVVAASAYSYLYKEQRNIAEEEAQHETEVKALKQAFETDETTANQNYLDKTVAVKGTVTAVDTKTNTITLEESVFCITQTTENPKIGSTVIIKGRLIGFDSLLAEVKMDQCTLLKN